MSRTKEETCLLNMFRIKIETSAPELVQDKSRNWHSLETGAPEYIQDKSGDWYFLKFFNY
jgi:hypothetical protein